VPVIAEENKPFIKLQKEFSPFTAARLINVENTFIMKELQGKMQLSLF
jgi:hypothetical protein